MSAAPVIQAERLSELEAVIERGLATFVEVGAALTEIREQRLYIHRDGFTSFEQYCKTRWNMSKPYATRLIESATVVRMVPIGTTPIPNEAVARELAPLKNDPPRLRAVWSEATRANPKPTARDVRSVLQRVSVPDVEIESEDEAQTLSDQQAREAFDALADACAIVADLRPPREFLAMLPGERHEYPLVQLRRAHAWLSALFEEIESHE